MKPKKRKIGKSRISKNKKAKTKIALKKSNFFSKKAKAKSGKIERVPTGIKNFDSLIEGGFPKNSTNLVIGDAGGGKTIFATQFLIEGIKKGEKCLYVTFEEKKNRFYKNMARFGWNLEEYERKGNFKFMEYTPMKIKTMLEEGGGAIEAIVTTEKVTRIVVDSITSFALLFKDELQKREAAISLFNMIKRWSCTSLITLEEDPVNKKGGSRPIEFESDSTIMLYFLREKKQRQRILEIMKMRGTNHSRSMYKFEINSRGIDIEKKPIQTPSSLG